MMAVGSKGMGQGENTSHARQNLTGDRGNREEMDREH
jgi:hypothetical protein